MEGKSEFFDDQRGWHHTPASRSGAEINTLGRYTPMRLHNVVLHLVSPSEPLFIPPQDPARPLEQHICLAVPFELRVPGWLPPSHTSALTNTSYGVCASATLGWSSTVLPSLIDQVRVGGATRLPTKNSKAKRFFSNSFDLKADTKTSSEFITFDIRRHRLPRAFGRVAREREDRQYTLRPDMDSASPIECVVSTPDWVDVNGEEKSLKISLRLRARRNAILSDVAADVGHTGGEEEGTQAEQGCTPDLDSMPMEKDVTGASVGEDVLTHMLELGMEVEEFERFS